MALTGHLSDLSLSELIEFFCNQRKSGRLKVLYPKGAGSFYLQAGSVVDARIGVLYGIDAVYYALTLPNAQFEFSADAEAVERTINQPWTQVVLEGLRRLDEGIAPEVAFPSDYVPDANEPDASSGTQSVDDETQRSFTPAFFSFNRESAGRKPLFIGAIAVAVVASVAVIGVPAGWYRSNAKPVAAVESTSSTTPTVQPQAETVAPAATETSPSSNNDDAAALAARRQREKDKDKARRDAARAQNESQTLSPAPTEPSKPGAKRVTVTVSYDESGRVTQASGGDATAVRIARQKRFPPGKAGSATITIPIN